MLGELLMFNMRFKALVREILEDPSVDKLWDLLYEVDLFAERTAHTELKTLVEEVRVENKKDILLSTYRLSSLISDRVRDYIREEVSHP